MGGDAVQHISSKGSVMIEDSALESWQDSIVDRVRGERDKRKESEDPFDVGVANPRAIDLVKLYELAGKPIPPGVASALGANIPVLLCHGMTPFYKAGQRPTGVWGMGYEAKLKGEGVTPVSVHPETRKYDVAKVGQQLEVGISAGGKIGIPEAGLEFGNAVPGVSITGAEVRATTDQNFALALTCTFSVLEVHAGPVGAGAKWNLYRGRESIEGYQPLFHTVLVPEGTESLAFEIETWIRRSGRFFNLGGTRHWAYPPKKFKVSLEGLGGN